MTASRAAVPACGGNANLGSWQNFGTDGRKSVSAFWSSYLENDRNGTSRINIAGLTSGNIGKFIDALADVAG